MAIRIAIWFLLVVSVGESSFGQIRKYSYQQLTEQQGLAQNFVYGLSQDERGFLWIGTGVGLSRYDGYEIKNFTVRDSLSADFITADLRTKSGNVIFGHNEGGVTFFDGIRFHPLIPDTLDNKIVSITESNRNEFWVATQSKGLIYINQRTGALRMLMPDELEGQMINVVYAHQGVLWVGTNEGLVFYRIRNGELTPEHHSVLPPYVSVNAIAPHREDSTMVWIGTGFNGLYLAAREPDNKIREKLVFELPEFSKDVIQAIAQDAMGDVWVGTRQNGALHLNISRDRKSIYRVHNFRKRTGFPFSSVNELLIDRQGQIWISTMGDGVVKLYKELFTYFPFATEFGVTDVRAIAETASGYLVATDVGLLEITLNLQSDEYQVKALNVLKGESILTVFTDSRGTTWVATEELGLFQYAGEIERLQPVVLSCDCSFCHLSIGPQNEPLRVRLFEEDKKGNIWISAHAQGVYLLNPEGKVLKHLTTANKFIHNDVFAIKADSRDNIWFGTYGAGLAMIDAKGTLQLLSKADSLRARDINDISEDDQGNIWVATEGDGFFKYDGKNFIQIGSAENLISPFIKGMQFDPTGRIWFSYRKGLGYYDMRSDKKYHFNKQDGLLANEAYSSSIIVDSKTNKWFCNDYGITLFEHDTIAESRRELQTYLTAIRIFFKDYPANLHYDSDDGRTLRRLPPLTLAHEQNHITFDFVAIKLNRTGKIYYRHQLVGYDTDWTPAETANFITYTNLDPGKYTLKVQATDDPGAWVDPVTEYAFEITPPYWKRTWFYLLQIFSVLTLFGLTYFIGKKGISTKRYVLRLMLFSSFFITLEYVENFIDPLVSDFFGGAPVFRFFLNFVLALLLLPVETLITHWLMDNKGGLGETIETDAVTLNTPVLEEERVSDKN